MEYSFRSGGYNPRLLGRTVCRSQWHVYKGPWLCSFLSSASSISHWIFLLLLPVLVCLIYPSDCNMASGGSSLALAALLLVSCTAAVAATQYTVGDKSGWATGTDYTTWASGKKFKVGDTLVFNYAGGAHTVDEVSASDYAACSSSKALSSDSTGTTTVTLKTAGKHYFICGVTGHCSGGMKLVVDVAAAKAATPAPAPAPTKAPAPAADTPDTPDSPDTTPATKTPSSPSSSDSDSDATPTSPATPRAKESSTSGATGLRAAAWAGLGLAGLVAMF